MTDQTPVTKSRLGEMALDAAINIELAEKNGNLNPTEDLENFLSAIKKQFNEDNNDLNLRDETMFPYYSFALARATNKEQPSRRNFSNLMSSMLRKQEKSGNTVDNQDQLKQFCLAFHEAMIRAVNANKPRKADYDDRVR